MQTNIVQQNLSDRSAVFDLFVTLDDGAVIVLHAESQYAAESLRAALGYVVSGYLRSGV